MKVFFLFVATVLCLSNLITLNAEAIKGDDPRLTCKYFDSLQINRKVCASVNRGFKVNLKGEGQNKSLYSACIKAMDSGAYRDEWRSSEYYSKGKMSFEGWLIDLNGDGREEAIVLPSESLFRGGPGNGDIFVLKRASNKRSEKWHLIGVLSGNALYIESHKTNGYFDMIAHWHTSATSGYLTRCKMLKKNGKYEMGISREHKCYIESLEPCFNTLLSR